MERTVARTLTSPGRGDIGHAGSIAVYVRERRKSDQITVDNADRADALRGRPVAMVDGSIGLASFARVAVRHHGRSPASGPGLGRRPVGGADSVCRFGTQVAGYGAGGFAG
jgi:hypothetical protein